MLMAIPDTPLPSPLPPHTHTHGVCFHDETVRGIWDETDFSWCSDCGMFRANAHPESPRETWPFPASLKLTKPGDSWGEQHQLIPC